MCLKKKTGATVTKIRTQQVNSFLIISSYTGEKDLWVGQTNLLDSNKYYIIQTKIGLYQIKYTQITFLV